MLIIGIVFFLMAASTGSIYLRYRGVRLAYIWLILIISISLVWVALLIIQPDKISPLIIENWININASPINLLFQINNINWPISISYFSFLLAYLLSSIAHLKGINSLYDWVEIVVLIVSGWVFLLAGDYWSILIGWTLIDFVELIFHFRHKAFNSDSFYSHFLIKFFGSLLLIYGISRSYQVNPISLFEKDVEGIGLIVPLAAILHSGILSNIANKPDGKVFPNKPIIFLQIISFISSFFLLSFAPHPNLSILTNLLIKLLLFGLATREMYKWAAIKDGLPGIRRILFAFGAVISLMFLSGAGEVIGVWLIVLLVPIGWLYLYTDRDSKTLIFLFLTLFFISGFPFSLTYEGYYQLILQGKWIDMFFVTVPMAIVISGCINHGSKKSGNFDDLEPWYQVFYLIGLFLPLISMSAIVLRSSLISFNGWWIGLLIMSFSIFLYFFRFNSEEDPIDPSKTKQRDFGLGTRIISGLQLLNNRTFIILENLLSFFSRLFEGNGGILWSVVFLALFLTILKFQGGI